MRRGLTFFKTTNLKNISLFYQQQIGCTMWLDQGGCHILQYGNMLLGFCQREGVDACGTITFAYPSKGDVDAMYDKLKSRAQEAPLENKEYRIYHFYAVDPEGRSMEFQYFWDDLPSLTITVPE